MTRTQRRLVAFIRMNRARVVGGYELRDAVLPGRDVKNVHVQLHRARRAGEGRISSRRGACGGYQWDVTA